MTSNKLIAEFKTELLRLGLNKEVLEITAIQDAIQFYYNDDKWLVPFPWDVLDEMKKIANQDEFVEFINENGVCNEDYNLIKDFEENVNSFLLY